VEKTMTDPEIRIVDQAGTPRAESVPLMAFIGSDLALSDVSLKATGQAMRML
jgi:hypothetical protein